MSVLSVVQVISYLTKKFAELHSPNKFKVYMGHGGKPWVSDFNHPHYMAGRRALQTGQLFSLGAERPCGPCGLHPYAGRALPSLALGVGPLFQASCGVWTRVAGQSSAVDPSPHSPGAHHFFYSIPSQFLASSRT